MQIRLIDIDDWKALYIDGKVVMQNHELNISDVIRMIAPDADFKIAYLDSDEIDGGWCPNKWSQKLENRTEDGDK
jgi:hypothetical protein